MRKQHRDVKEQACDICDMVFEQEADLRAHIKQMHYQTEFICNVCDKVCQDFIILLYINYVISAWFHATNTHITVLLVRSYCTLQCVIRKIAPISIPYVPIVFRRSS